MADRWFSKFSSESKVISVLMVIRGSAALVVICIPSIDTTSGLLVLRNRCHFPGLAFK